MWQHRNHEHLSSAATELTNGLCQFQKNLNLPLWVSGSVPVTASIEIQRRCEEEGHRDVVSFESPFENVSHLYASADQSQVGTADETVIRLEARNSKEFSQLRVSNAEWEIQLKKVCEEVKQVLCPGVDSVVPELYKMLLYK